MDKQISCQKKQLKRLKLMATLCFQQALSKMEFSKNKIFAIKALVD